MQVDQAILALLSAGVIDAEETRASGHEGALCRPDLRRAYV